MKLMNLLNLLGFVIILSFVSFYQLSTDELPYRLHAVSKEHNAASDM